MSVGAGYGILVWDLLIDTNEDISEFVDRLIDARIAEQQVWFSRSGSVGPLSSRSGSADPIQLVWFSRSIELLFIWSGSVVRVCRPPHRRAHR